MKKKVLALFLVAAMSVQLLACGNIAQSIVRENAANTESQADKSSTMSDNGEIQDNSVLYDANDSNDSSDNNNENVRYQDDYSKLIAENISNWEKERVCVIDMIIMKIAITELIHFEQIPVKVTMNEYIEISKYFSTPKSKIFINGILDRVSKKLLEEKVIVKKGLGLLDSK